MIRYKENQDWECSVEKMISYLIEANRTITDPKNKKRRHPVCQEHRPTGS